MRSTVEKLPLARALKACSEDGHRGRRERRDDQNLLRPRLWICGRPVTPQTGAAFAK